METTNHVLHHQLTSKFTGRIHQKVGWVAKLVGRIVSEAPRGCCPNLGRKYRTSRAPVRVQVLEGVGHCHQQPFLVLTQDKLTTLCRWIQVDLLLVLPVVFIISNLIILFGEAFCIWLIVGT